MSGSIALTVLGFVTAVSALPQQKQKTLQWEPCPDLNKQIAELSAPFTITKFDCAKLQVPLDYSYPDTSEMIELDLFRVNATEQPVLGSILYNPGGPGGTAAENLPLSAPDLHLNIGGQYNLVSWDPRGTGNTIPFFNCGVADAVSSSDMARRDTTLANTNMTEVFLNGGWEQSVALADACFAKNNRTGHFIGTGSVAHDMISIIDALGEDGLLRYYGWSYGTALGDYFAAMFPERVERMVLDGNVNPYTWQLGSRSEAFQDADKAFSAFIEECFANAEACALVSATNTTSPAELFELINASIAPLAENATLSYEAFTSYLGLVAFPLNFLYYPATWPVAAQILADTLLGVVPEGEDSSAPAPPPVYNLGVGSLNGIRCSDATFQVSSPEEYLPTLATQLESTDGFGAAYASLWPCAAWKMPDKQQYRGNFQVNTRHPILYVNGEFDVITPISGAYNASAAFEGSIVLAHDGYGHGIFPNPSKCVAEKIHRYFVEGVLPGKGTRCQPDFGPWELAAYYEAQNITRPYGGVMLWVRPPGIKGSTAK
jgi:pimeloyl-ACP methyl ester carboxylesterase